MGYGFRTGGWGGPTYRAYGGGRFSFGFGITPIVKKLIIINAVAFFVLAVLSATAPQMAAGLVRTLGVVPRDTLFRFHLWQPFTYLFLHGGFWHLFFNMFGLWMFGTPLERDWGSRRFLRYYLLTGVGAGLLNVVFSLVWGGPSAYGVTIGASGAIYGILLAFGLLYPNAPILIMFILPVPARVVVLMFGAVAFLSALEGPGSGISHVSHLGGMLFGYIYLRGGWLYHRLLGAVVDWRLKQTRRKFDVYMSETDEREEERSRPDRWIN